MFADFGAHQVEGLEWWYLTGPLWTASQDGSCVKNALPSYGLQATFFKSQSALKNEMSLLGHMAEVNLKSKTRVFNERFDITARPNTSLLSFVSYKDLFLQLTNWRMIEVAQDKFNFDWILQTTMDDIRYDFILKGKNQNRWEHGEKGMVQKINNTANRYISVVDIQANGTRLNLKTGLLEKICGDFWYDQEIGVNKIENVKWSWFSATLNNDLSFMIYKLNSTTEEKVFGEVFENGKSKQLAAINIKPSNKKCTASKNCYFQNHSISFDYQKNKAELLFESLDTEQENISKIDVIPSYWEGITKVRFQSGKSKPKTGYGFVEITH